MLLKGTGQPREAKWFRPGGAQGEPGDVKGSKNSQTCPQTMVCWLSVRSNLRSTYTLETIGCKFSYAYFYIRHFRAFKEVYMSCIHKNGPPL